MIEKNTLKTKSFWTGILQFLAGIALAITGDTDTGVTLIGTGMSTIVLRDAIKKNEK